MTRRKTLSKSLTTLSLETVPYVGDGGPTVKKDKRNDNLLFACCCARVDWTWTTVCSCYGGGWKCDQTCVEDALIEESLFYPSGTVSDEVAAFRQHALNSFI